MHANHKNEYDQEMQIDIYGGSVSCGEVDLCDESEDIDSSDTEQSAVELDSYVVIRGQAGDVSGSGKKRIGNARSRVSGVSGVSGVLGVSGVSGGEEECGECSIAIDGPVCSDEKAIMVVKSYLAQKQPASVTLEKMESPIDIIASAKQVTSCKTEECVLHTIAKENPDTNAIMAETIRDNFKVDGPADSTKWLNNSNIDHVLAQLVKKHPNVYRLPFHMADFEEQKVSPGTLTLKNINLIRDVINADKNMLCVVINTDYTGKPGQHWFAIFCDSSKTPFTIEYFNSSGAPLTGERLIRIKDWMQRAEMELEAGGYPVKRISAAVIQHQRSDTECGVYSLYYIYRRIRGASIEEFATRIPDSDMIAFRKKLFRNRETSPAN